MTFEDMRNLIKNGHYIGSHTMNHKRLSELKFEKDLYDEIVISKLILEKELKISVEHFAFPFGDINSISAQAMKLASQYYKYIYSGVRGLNTLKVKRHAIRRESLNISLNFSYNMLLANNGISFKDRKTRHILDKLISG